MCVIAKSLVVNKQNLFGTKSRLPYIQNGKLDEMDVDNHPFSYLRSLSHHIRPEQLQVAPQPQLDLEFDHS